MPSPSISVEPVRPTDREWVEQFIVERWGAPTVVAHGVAYQAHEAPGFIAVHDGERVGLVTYYMADDACEIVSLDSARPNRGVGTALVDAVTAEARRRLCGRVWLITTNDNLRALGFYQKRGFVLVAIHRDAIAQARKLKPEIPLIGDDGIPIRDEIELELPLS